MAKDEKLGALWENEGKNGMYLSGVIGGKKVVIFKNGYKKEDKHPDWIVYPQGPRDEVQDKPQDEEVPF